MENKLGFLEYVDIVDSYNNSIKKILDEFNSRIIDVETANDFLEFFQEERLYASKRLDICESIHVGNIYEIKNLKESIITIPGSSYSIFDNNNSEIGYFKITKNKTNIHQKLKPRRIDLIDPNGCYGVIGDVYDKKGEEIASDVRVNINKLNKECNVLSQDFLDKIYNEHTCL